MHSTGRRNYLVPLNNYRLPLKLGSPQPIRYCSATGCFSHRVLENYQFTYCDRQPVNVAPDNTKHKRKKRPVLLRFGSWNVRTMSSGTDDDICNIKSVRKSAMIDNELHRLNVDIAALQETRLADQGSTREKHYTFFWHGKPKKDRREHGVGFAVRNTLAKSVEIGENGSERVLSLRLRTSTGCATLVSAYAPTLCGEEADKDEFYEQLHNLVSSIPERDHLILLGDFNARVGDDHVAWGNCLGKFGYGKMNSNGQRLLELCSWHKLCVTNSFFHTKQIHKVSWRHPRSKAWHQLDLILVKKQHLNDVKLTRSYHSACCDSDHSLVCCKIRISVNRLHKSKEPRKARLNTSKMYVTGLTKQFASLLAERTSSGETTSWTDIRETVYKTALDTFGKKVSKIS